MKVNELREKSAPELGKLLFELTRERFNLNMQKATGQLSKPDRIKTVRKEIARIHTILRQKEMAR